MHDPWVCTLITMWVCPSVSPWSVSENACNHWTTWVYFDQILHTNACQYYLTTGMCNILIFILKKNKIKKNILVTLGFEPLCARLLDHKKSSYLYDVFCINKNGSWRRIPLAILLHEQFIHLKQITLRTNIQLLSTIYTVRHKFSITKHYFRDVFRVHISSEEQPVRNIWLPLSSFALLNISECHLVILLNFYGVLYTPKIVSEYDQEIPQSQIADSPVFGMYP